MARASTVIPVAGYVVTERRDGELLLGDDYRCGPVTTLDDARAELARFAGPAYAGRDMVLVELREVASTGKAASLPGPAQAPEHAAPIHDEPLSLHPPYYGYAPPPAGESTAAFRQRRHREALDALLAPLEGLEVTAFERRRLEWLAGWDVATVATIAALLHRARSSQPIQGGTTQ